jgi:hypothetical protein
MKQLFFLLFLLRFSIALSQEDKNANNKNYYYDITSDTIIENIISNNYDLLFTNFNFPFLDTFSNPNFPVFKKISLNDLRITRNYFYLKKNYLQEINESQTLLFYSVGSNNTQNLDIQHLQKISRKIIGEIHYVKNKSDGFYQNQKIKNDFVDVNLSFTNEKKTYLFLPYFKYILKKNHENGGIKYDSTFKDGDFINPLTLETNLNEAFNRWDIYDGGIDQIIHFKKFILKDNISYRYQERKYTDNPREIFYENIYLDSNTTLDKYQLRGFHHSISVFQNGKKIKTNLEIESDFLEYKNGNIDTTSFQNKLNLNIDYIKTNYSIKITGNYVTSGFNKNNYSINLGYNYHYNKLIEKIQINAKYQNYITDIKHLLIDANNYQWNNSFNNSTDIFINTLIKSKCGDLKLSHDIYNNYVILNDYIIPTQVSSAKKIEVKYEYRIEQKKIDFKISGLYQYFYTGSEYFKVPDFTFQMDLVLKIKLKALDAKFGIKGNYFTVFYANAYDPSLNDFYLQNVLKVGNYPFLDFYFQAKIKTVELKFIINHFNSGLTGFNYYTTPLYPMAPRYFQFAFSWFFRD